MSTTTTSPPPSIPPLTLIIRFTTSLPDLPLTIASPHRTTPTTLCALIRPHLPAPYTHSPLRLIYSGALLPPTTSLQKCLRLSTTGKSPAQLYIHCAVSSETRLSPAELDVEAASLLPASDTQKTGHGEEGVQHDDDDNNESARSTTAAASPSTTTNPPLHGFDLLLTAGLTPTEVASLRSQFHAVQAHTHTPDTMPSGAEMRLLEERWLDAGPTQPLQAGEDEEGGAGGGLEDMLWGNVMGFFWAVGAVVWLVREDGVWSKRRQVGVVTGVLVNVAFCMLRFGV